MTKTYTISVRKESSAVVLVINGRRALELGWRAARDVCDAMRPHARGEATEEARVGSGLNEVAFRTQPKLPDEAEDMVLCIIGGQLAFDAPTAVMLTIWMALCGAQRQLEEEQPANVERVAFDGGLLLRSGAPFGLTDNPKLQAEVVKEAGHNRDLRRFLPGGIRGEVLAAPRIFRDTRTPAERLRAMARTSPRTHQRILAALH